MAQRLGMSSLVLRSGWRSKRLLILCYHGVSLEDEHEWNPALFVSQAQLRRRFARLRSLGANVLSLGEGIRRLYDGTLPARSVVLTFDDGNYDFTARALPLLLEFRFPATVYLTTYYVSYQRPVFDPALSYILWHAGAAGTINGVGLLPWGRRWSWRSVAERAALVNLIRERIKSEGLSAGEKDAVLSELATQVGADYQRILDRRILHLMSPAEVQQLPADLVDVQLHTHRHCVPRQEPLFAREILENRGAVRALQPISDAAHFCYPSGVHFPEFLPWLGGLGIVSATTCEPGLASTLSNPLLLPRLIDTMSVTDQAFDGWVSGLAAMLPQRRHIRGLAFRGTRKHKAAR